MMPVAVAHALLAGIVVLSLVLMLVRPKNLPEICWVGPGAVLLVVLRLIPLRLAVQAVREGTDVYLFLIGMMLLSELARENGVFEWLSAVAVKHARGSSARLFGLIYAIGTAVTIAMSNDATAVVLTPAVLAAVRRAQVNPLPYLFACAMIANSASFVLPISNPANLVVFHVSMPSLGQWLARFMLPSLASVVVTFGVLRWYFRRDLRDGTTTEQQHAQLSRDGKLVLAGIVSMVAVLLAASALKLDLGLPTCIAGAIITAILCVRRRESPWPLLRAISWTTLALVAALFLMVKAVETIGMLAVARSALEYAASLPSAAGALVVAFVVGLGNNLINNLPMGLIAGRTLSATHVHGAFADAVLIGVDLGPNLSVTGSLATILWLMAIRREGLNVRFQDFLKVGAIAMPLGLLACMGCVLLLRVLFGTL